MKDDTISLGIEGELCIEYGIDIVTPVDKALGEMLHWLRKECCIGCGDGLSCCTGGGGVGARDQACGMGG